jgi:hypothetical protein
LQKQGSEFRTSRDALYRIPSIQIRPSQIHATCEDSSSRCGSLAGAVRIRLATERMPCVWLWNVTIHLTGGLPMGSAKDIETAKAEFKAAWEALKARTAPEQLAAA